MNIPQKPLNRYLLPAIENLPMVGVYAKTRGWPFVIAWAHRLAGVLLALYALLHIYTLSYLATPDIYDAKMKVYVFFLFSFLEWLLALPVISTTFLANSRIVISLGLPMLTGSTTSDWRSR